MEEKDKLYLRLKQAIIWLKNKDILQKDIAVKMEMSTVGFSRGVARCKEKYDEDFVIKFHQATDEIFSLDWLLHGTGEKFTADIKKAEPTPAIPAPAPVDASSAINAAISAYVELTNRLKQEMAERLADKEAIIDEKNKRIVVLEREVATKDTLNMELQRKVARLESELSMKHGNDTVDMFSFNPGLAEQPNITNK